MHFGGVEITACVGWAKDNFISEETMRAKRKPTYP